jgi:enterobactin synthetase component D
MAVDVAFELALEHGRCVGVTLPEADVDVDDLARAALLPEERAFAATLSSVRRRTWVGGRVALRQALTLAGLEAPALLSDPRGAPLLPNGVAGSVTHKARVAAALVTLEASARVGVDIENDEVGSVDISTRVLTGDEIGELALLEPRSRAREVLLRFSAKEALYKALDPFVQRYVGFKEAVVSTRPDGGADVTLRLRPGEGPFLAEVRWRRLGTLVLTTARVVPRT